ncbi:hypothetical protein RF11_01838 [Thelohanellus kitauei]|uniref:Uncharacterized protein n=1 Tax=Thelohanellus kitauei TaxID=669202 RepID=A0A0C2MN90_THEKT|nr:hypothetical protein RF11_01838 [Thelohanellus kitauei]
MNLVKNSLGNYWHLLMEIRFQLTPGSASLYAGVPGIIVTALSLFLSSLLMKKYRHSNQKLFLINIITGTVSCICFMGLLLYCHPDPIKGFHKEGITWVVYNNQDSGIQHN